MKVQKMLEILDERPENYGKPSKIQRKRFGRPLDASGSSRVTALGNKAFPKDRKVIVNSRETMGNPTLDRPQKASGLKRKT